MRCPYCQIINQEKALYCVQCGRDMRDATSFTPLTQQTQQRQGQPYPPSVSAYQQRPNQQPPNQQPQQQRPGQQPPSPYRQPTPTQPQQRPPAQQPRPAAQPQPTAGNRPAPTATRTPEPAQWSTPAAPPAPQPPGPYPPRTFAQLKALLEGAQPYTVLNETIENKHKRIVRITYARCVGWQQVATLLKALNDLQDSQHETIIIAGFTPQNQSAYDFTNGQLRFDRAIRLGSLTTNRYQIETETGFAIDSVRIVMTED